jgi:hypothetical protein
MNPGANPRALLLFLFLNLLAAYAPALFCLPLLPAGANRPLVLLFFPVASGLLGSGNLASAWCGLGAFYLVVLILSACFYPARVARLVLPAVLFAHSLLQGYGLVGFIAGLNALGHS